MSSSYLHPSGPTSIGDVIVVEIEPASPPAMKLFNPVRLALSLFPPPEVSSSPFVDINGPLVETDSSCRPLPTKRVVKRRSLPTNKEGDVDGTEARSAFAGRHTGAAVLSAPRATGKELDNATRKSNDQLP